MEANHVNPKDVNKAYICFLKSPKIINLMAELLKDRENFNIVLGSERTSNPYEYFGNLISGTTYGVYFLNKQGEKTQQFENIIRNVSEKQEEYKGNELEKLEMLEKVLEENSDSDLYFSVSLNTQHQPYMKKTGQINELIITTKSGEERVEGDFIIHTERDMEVLASILSEKYNIKKRQENLAEYSETEFIMPSFDKCSCSVYFTDDHFNQVLEQIQYIKQIAHTIPTFEGKEWNGYDDDEILDEYDNDEWDIDEEFEKCGYEKYEIDEEFFETLLSKKEEVLSELEREAEEILVEEQQIPEIRQLDNEKD